MINLPQIIVNLLVGFLDSLKITKPRIWALIGALFVTLDYLLLSGILPFADKIPAIASQVVVGLALYLTNSSTTKQLVAVQTGNRAGTIGGTLDEVVAQLIAKFKAGNLTVYSVVTLLLGGLKFYVLNDPSLAWPDLAVNAILDIALLFTIPQTKPTLIKMGKMKFNSDLLITTPIIPQKAAA